jgi:hypothetical protein
LNYLDSLRSEGVMGLVDDWGLRFNVKLAHSFLELKVKELPDASLNSE